MADLNQPKIVWSGRHLSIALRGGWEHAIRNTQKPVVGIVALTDDQRVVLVEQYRPPVDHKVVELPAGLTGDTKGNEHESLVAAAQRELLEETGYTAARWTELARGYSSPGLTNELIVLFLAEGLTRVGTGGGDGGESITIHEVPFEDVTDWLATHGGRADLKLFAALYAAQAHLGRREKRR